MAKEAIKVDAPPQAAPASGTSIMSLMIAMFVLTGLSMGAGGLFGLQVLSRIAKHAPAVKVEAPAGDARHGRFSDKVSLYALSPIVTNLASPERAWIRIEASLVIDGEGVETKVLAASITEDTLAYLRTVSLPLIEGASGYLHLREELNDRVRVRSAGKARELILHSLIVE
jgi:flagellar FliL protein